MYVHVHIYIIMCMLLPVHVFGFYMTDLRLSAYIVKTCDNNLRDEFNNEDKHAFFLAL